MQPLPGCRLFQPVFQLLWHANGHLHPSQDLGTQAVTHTKRPAGVPCIDPEDASQAQHGGQERCSQDGGQHRAHGGHASAPAMVARPTHCPALRP
ncbi:hypothetical protein G6F60_014993 [Rhizopus arrhizus]|nr:hypothetical protein G6F60_014993 [Rhizopus arrhizus]